jgi:hypothetical protein
MILLEDFSGRFGNKFLSYNNVRQIAHRFSQQWCVPSWEGDLIFERSSRQTVNNAIRIAQEDLMMPDCEIQKILDANDVIIDPHALGSIFFRFISLNPRQFVTKNFDNNHKQVGIHFRGTDFVQWNPKSILDSDYYLDSLKMCLDSSDELEFVLFTDDHKLESFNNVLSFLESNNIKHRFGLSQITGNFLDDFIDLASSSIIVSSPSTFAISAGMIGNSRIIHSKKWIEHRISENDKFWVDLQNIGTTFYSLWAQV